MAVQQHEEGMGVLALLEYRAVLRKAQRAGLAKDLCEFNRIEARKQRQMGDQRRVECGHVPSEGGDLN